MPTKSVSPPSPAEVKSQLEAIAGHDIAVSAEALLLRLWYRAGAFAFEDGNVTWRNAIRPGQFCNPARLLDASGTTFTDANGQRLFLLSGFVCGLNANSLLEPVNFIATPSSTMPFFVTSTYKLINAGPGTFNTDVEFSVFSWDPGGKPAPNVSIDWRCWIPADPIIF